MQKVILKAARDRVPGRRGELDQARDLDCRQLGGEEQGQGQDAGQSCRDDLGRGLDAGQLGGAEILEQSQFVAGVVESFGPDFLDRERCREWVLERLHGHDPACPECGGLLDDPRRLARWRANGRIRCGGCGKFYSATTGTFMAGSRLGFRQVVLLALLMGLGLSNAQAAAILGCSAEAARLWRARFIQEG